MEHTEIILASASPRRRELLEKIGLTFRIVTSDKEERYQSTTPKEIVQELALLKAKDVSEKVEKKGDTVIIGADTVVVQDGKILGKPKDEKDAVDMLRSLQGRAHSVYTGTAVLKYKEDQKMQEICHATETKVYVAAMTEEEIASYVASGESSDKAGAYAIQGRFSAFIERIEGDYANVVGLPVAYIYQVLKSLK